MTVEKPWWWREYPEPWHTPDYLAKKEVERRKERGVVGDLVHVGTTTFWVEFSGDPSTGGIHAYCLTTTWMRTLHFWRHPEGALRVCGREDCGRLTILPALKRAINKACLARARVYRIAYRRISEDWHQWGPV